MITVMLWRVCDFKGIRSANVDLRRGKATVLTGVNSSGKSSIIQSLLLAAQSLHSETQVVLNGPLVRLGDAQDLVREGSDGGAIELTVGLDGSNQDEELIAEDFQATFVLAPADDRSSLRVRGLRISLVDEKQSPLIVGRENSRASDVALAKSASARLGSRDALHLKSLFGSERRQLRTYVAMQGLRPVGIVQLLKASEVESRYRSALGSLLEESKEARSLKADSTVTARWGTGFVREFVALLGTASKETQDESLRSLIETFSNVRNGNPYAFEISWGKVAEADRRTLIDAAAQVRKARPYLLLPIRGNSFSFSPSVGLLEGALAETLGNTYDLLGLLHGTLDNIGERVQYLGPLRDEPRVVWNHWNELAHGLPVGTRGEYSAAVLSRFGTSTVTFARPDSKLVRDTLSEAVNLWLTYLNIGDRVTARAQGKLGVGLDLRVDGQIRDLTSVGVGVSQALPLLVGLLSAPKNSLFIVEQPELHLHPSVQARLADFMMSARPDVALIVETHSEAFVTRIRRRAAEGHIALGDVDICFVEPGATGSVARVLEISQFGDLSEWPDGFLSDSSEDIRAILAANIKRSPGSM